MEKALVCARIFFFIVLSISLAVIAYAQTEIAKSKKIQAVACVMQQDNAIKGICNVASYKLLIGGFSIEEIYTYLYRAENLPNLVQD